MAEKCRALLANEVRKAKYFSLIVDSTPDIAHIDQLAIILRYVQSCGTPTEVFLTFVPNAGHKAQELFTAVTESLLSFGIDLMDCRGQSYDNAANMSGTYTGLQARIRAVNKYADFVPCSAHSLNLVGSAATDSCAESTAYFVFVQGVYNFSSATTARWKKLCDSGSQLSVESLSKTRWSRGDDACKALLKSWGPIRETL